MSKTFAPRVSKRERTTIDLTEKVDLKKDYYQLLEERNFLRGAILEVLHLKEISVLEQVRTKFNDSSLKELAENIKINGLIQPLVVHRDNRGKYTLICGERRFRAMTLNGQVEAPCFVLEGKTHDELMAIQFSENSSREQLHYIDKADGIFNYQQETGASERKIVAALGISKTEVHRSLLIAKLPKRLKEAAKQFNTEKYVLLELDALPPSPLKMRLEDHVLTGKITKRAQLKKSMNNGGRILHSIPAEPKKKVVVSKKQKSVTAAMFIKAMKSKSSTLGLDEDTQALLNKLVKETKDLIELQ